MAWRDGKTTDLFGKLFVRFVSDRGSDTGDMLGLRRSSDEKSLLLWKHGTG